MIAYGVDARNLPLDDEAVDCVVTSPPFFGLRTYGVSDDEIGQGDLDAYLADTRLILRELQRVLKPTGLLWFNIGDTAAGSGGAGGDYGSGGAKAGKPRYRQGKTGTPPGQWLLIPQRVALLAQADGWLVRSWVTWNKGNRRPESLRHVRRPGVQSEVILMLAKTRDYYFDETALEEAGDVWSFPPSRRGRSHLAPFPAELPRRCILLSTSPGDTVLDPFVGSGTTVEAAEELNRLGVGFDLYDYS